MSQYFVITHFAKGTMAIDLEVFARWLELTITFLNGSFVGFIFIGMQKGVQ